MVLRIVKKDVSLNEGDRKTVIYPLVQDFNLTDSKIFIYRKIPTGRGSQDTGELKDDTVILTRKEVAFLEVCGF